MAARIGEYVNGLKIEINNWKGGGSAPQTVHYIWSIIDLQSDKRHNLMTRFSSFYTGDRESKKKSSYKAH